MTARLSQIMQILCYMGKRRQNFTGLSIIVNYTCWLSWDTAKHWYCSERSIYVWQHALVQFKPPTEKSWFWGRACLTHRLNTFFYHCPRLQSQHWASWPLAESRVTRGSAYISSEAMRDAYGKKLPAERLRLFTWAPWWQHTKVRVVMQVTQRHKN